MKNEDIENQNLKDNLHKQKRMIYHQIHKNLLEIITLIKLKKQLLLIKMNLKNFKENNMKNIKKVKEKIIKRNKKRQFVNIHNLGKFKTKKILNKHIKYLRKKIKRKRLNLIVKLKEWNI